MKNLSADVPPVSAKSDLGAVVAHDGADWLADVVVGRPAHAQALLERCCNYIDTVLDGQAPRNEADFGATARRARGYGVGRILHDLDMDAQTLAVGVIAGIDDVPGVSSVKAEVGEPVAALLAVVEKLRGVLDLPTSVDEGGQAERLRRLLVTMVSDVRAALVLLAERLYDLRAQSRVSVSPEIAAQTLSLHAPLASRLGIWHVKWELEDLSLRVREPEIYKDIARQLAQRRVDRECYINAVVERLREELGRAEIVAEVSGRPKHIYSIWRKMQAKSLGFHELFDVRAVRVLTENVAECYAALGVVHSLWSHMPREFDDYIANPKSNRYQSLHTAVIGPESRTLEVQIRTTVMHAHAERGVAAHWRYKEGGGPAAALDGRLAWLRQALEWRSEADDPARALSLLGQEHHDEHVYVLTPKGRVVELLSGATPVDFAYRIHTDIGHRTRGARVDGALISLTRPLQSGQTVEILTSRDGGPSRDWLNREQGYLATPRARSRVRHWFKRQDHDQNVSDGRAAWEREARRMRIQGADVAVLSEHFGLATSGDLYAAIGRGDVQLGQVVKAVQGRAETESLPRVMKAPSRRDIVATDEEVQGVGGLLSSMAQCCAPIPPEPIVGYITRGRGVSIHAQNCSNAVRLSADEPDRMLDLSWGAGEHRQYTVDITLSAYDRRGLLRDVSSVIADLGVDVRGMQSTAHRAEGTVEMLVSIDVTDMAELSRLMGRIEQIRNVYEVIRTSASES
ncbi:MAG: bifunctional (p)ppGpp synthetase/guanosine-3',5'-bis(diphosphate) 3'-pyrophosphohydrolase [Chromatiales bacterium]|nr:bifunctional (p)ppGpp synthetase/guanosine-3',5'-bis(diphosphate) 3'-pyrophosphohydrolase [Chromatiales bacterium]